MKAIAPLLLLFLGSVFSQEITIYCKLGRCPSGYRRHYDGINMLHAACLCSKPDPVAQCQKEKNKCESSLLRNCLSVREKCPDKDVLDLCDRGFFDVAKQCDKINAAAEKKKNEDLMKKSRQIYGTKTPFCYYDDYCKATISDVCSTVYDRCDVGTVLQQCKTGVIKTQAVCSEAQKMKARQDDRKTPYQCRSAIESCTRPNLVAYIADTCNNISSLCDSETIAKMCYKGELVNRFEDECAKAIKKSQELMLPVDQEKCSEKLKPCEQGNSDACYDVPTLCGKEVVAALCNAKKITNKRMCTYAGLDSTTANPGCDVFQRRCAGEYDDFYCDLESRYCGK